MIVDNDYFPTEFAKAMARKVKLYNRRDLHKYEVKKREKWERMGDMLAEFQQIAVLHGSEKAMNIYFAEDLNQKQKDALQIIGEFSRIQVSGEAINSMMEIISKNKNHKDYSKIVEAMVASVKEKDEKINDEDEMSKMVSKFLK